MTEEAPKRTGAPPKAVTLTGKLLPWSRDRPVLLSMPGSPLTYLPVFSEESELRAFMEQAKLPFVGIKKVDDGGEFIGSLTPDLTVILDPYYLPNGRVRFQQIQVG